MAARPRKPAGKAVMSFADQMAAEAAALAQRVQAPSGNKIDTKEKKFTLPNGTAGESIQVVIVDFINRNLFFNTAWRPNEISPPVCFALHRELKHMEPSENSPEVQAESCVECPMNQFGSDGGGKACKNSVRLAVLPVGSDNPEDLMLLDVSPTALKHFSAHVNTMMDPETRAKLMPVQVITEVTFDETTTYSSLRFKSLGPNPMAEAQYALREQATALIEVEPDISNYEPPKTKGRKR